MELEGRFDENSEEVGPRIRWSLRSLFHATTATAVGTITSKIVYQLFDDPTSIYNEPDMISNVVGAICYGICGAAGYYSAKNLVNRR